MPALDRLIEPIQIDSMTVPNRIAATTCSINSRRLL